MGRYVSAIVLAGIAIAWPGVAKAEGTDFGYVYTAQTEEPGETEVEMWVTDRRGKGEGHYDAQDYRLEVERGITDRFQLAAYVDLASHHIRDVGGEFERVDRDFAFRGLSAEFIYRLADPSHDRWGLALYAEPGWSRISKIKGEKNHEFELELKAIVQKNFLQDRLVWATNLTFEPEWEREREEIAPGVVESDTERELAIEATTGLSYRVASNWWLGVEGRYHSVYPDWTHGLHRENYAVHVGPTVHFRAGELGVTATWLPQLFGSPNHSGTNLEFDDHEKQELRLKLSYEF